MLSNDWERLVVECLDFAQRLIQTPSMPGEEGEIAELIRNEMRQLNFDEAWIDDIGNVGGRIEGRESGLGALVLNTHLDHVDPGDETLWSVPPYSGAMIDGRIHGRGACDIKGPLAVQIYSMAALRRAGIEPRRDIVFSGVVQEETGGEGAVYWVKQLNYPVDLVVLGEPSGNRVSLGHRGIFQIWATFHGRSVHASVPHRGRNPNFAAARFLNRLRSMDSQLQAHPILGETTVAPTIMEVDTTSMNVTPAWTRILLDFRTAAESPNSLRKFAEAAAVGLECTFSDAWSEAANVAPQDSDEIVVGFYTPPDSDAVIRARSLLAKAQGRTPELTHYEFATDGRHFAPLGIPVIGYAPGEEHLAHTVLESIPVSMMEESLRGHIQLLSEY